LPNSHQACQAASQPSSPILNLPASATLIQPDSAQSGPDSLPARQGGSQRVMEVASEEFSQAGRQPTRLAPSYPAKLVTWQASEPHG